MHNRIVVTGIGVVSAIGKGKKPFWNNLLKGKSGISRIKLFPNRDFRTHYGGEIKTKVTHKKAKDRSTAFLLNAIEEARKDAALHKKNNFYKRGDTGLTVGSFQLDHLMIEKINRVRFEREDNHEFLFFSRDLLKNSFASALELLDISGPSMNIPTVCSAGNYAIAYGFDMIRSGRAKAVYCCGTDVISRFLLAGFNRLLISSPDICSPFDKNRKGILVGEGAGVLVIETLENALSRKAPHIYAEILGYGLSCDAFSMTAPGPDGIQLVLKNALKNSGIAPSEVDYINTHGTGTLNNDFVECAAIKHVFGKHASKIHITSIKSMLGHAISASSAIEAVSCCLSMRDNAIPPTINYSTKDPDCDLNIVANKALRKPLNVILNNSFAFGGNNACLVFGRYK